MQKVNHFTLTYQVKMHHEDAGAFPDIVVQANLLLRQKKKVYLNVITGKIIMFDNSEKLFCGKAEYTLGNYYANCTVCKVTSASVATNICQSSKIISI